MKIKLGNDVKRQATIMRLGVAEDFSEATDIVVKVYKHNGNCGYITASFVRTDNVFDIYVLASTLTLGVYDCEISYKTPDSSSPTGIASHSTSYSSMFTIVSTAEEEDDEGQGIIMNVGYVKDGESAFIYIASASSALGADFTYPANISQDYLAILNSTTEIPEPSVTDFEGLWYSKIDAYRAAQIGGYTGTMEEYFAEEQNRVEAEILREQVKAQMEELNAHPPTLIDVDSRLIWHYWDLDTHAYVSSGLAGSLNWRGTYSGTETYLPLDVVSYNESTWLCITESSGNLPTTAYFTPIAKGSFQYWLEAGNTGTYEDYLLWLDSKEDVINKKQTVTNSETDYPSGKAVYNSGNIFNVTLAVPLTAGQYYTSTTARAAVPSGVRKRGLELVYETSAGVWCCERFIGASVTTWTTSTDWEIVPTKKYVDDADALKVNKSDIANNLTETAEGKVLDARQGKTLDDKITTSITDEKNIVPSIAFFKRVIADSGIVGDKTILAKLFTDKLKSLATTQVLFMPHLGLKERTSGVNKFASKVYDAGLSNLDAVQATEATQPYIGGFIAPNSLKALKYVQGQTQTGEVAFTEKSYLATDSWSLTIVLKANKRSARILLGANSYLEIGASTLTLHNGTAAILTATYSYDCGKTTIIGFHYANGLGLIKVDGVPLTTTVTSGAISFSKLAYSSAYPFDGLIYYFHLQNERISEAESQQNYTLLRALFPEIEGIAIGNQFWASSNFEGTVAGDGTIIPEVQLATSGEELITNAADREFTSDTGFWTKGTGVRIVDGVCYFDADRAFPGLSRGNILTSGKLYIVTITVTTLISGSVRVQFGGSTPEYTLATTTGTFSVIGRASDTERTFYVRERFVGTIDNISVKEASWSDLTYPAFCYYNNSPANGAVYGKQYNFPSITSLKNYPPRGYRVASYADWLQNSTYLGGNTISGRKLKKDGLVFWSTENTGTNEVGFSAIGSGKRGVDGVFAGLGTECNFWTSDGYLVTINNNANTITFTSGADAKIGAGVRLIRNSPVGDSRKQVESGFFTTNIASAAKSIAIPFGYVVKEIRITTTTSVTAIEAKLHNTAGTAVATLITGKACNATSTTFVVTADQPTQLTDPTIRVTAAGNNATSIGMNITVIIEKIEL